MSEYRDMLLGLARGIVAQRECWITRGQIYSGTPNGSMKSAITQAVAQGIEMGIEIGRQAERNEIIDQLKERSGETNGKACDETAPVAGMSGRG
jgi:hypothetical protein